MIDEYALVAAQQATRTAGPRRHLQSAPVPLEVLRAAITAYLSARSAAAETSHACCNVPGWEYETKEGPRKQEGPQDYPPDGDGWEPNVDIGRRGWERFDYTEESYWRRPVAKTPPSFGYSLGPVTEAPDHNSPVSVPAVQAGPYGNGVVVKPTKSAEPGAWRDIETDPPGTEEILVGGFDAEDNPNQWKVALSQREDLPWRRGFNHRNGARWATYWAAVPAPSADILASRPFGKQHMTERFKAVSAQELDDFVAQYPRGLVLDVLASYEPPLVTYNDFELGIWPESVVAHYRAADRGEPAYGHSIHHPTPEASDGNP